MRKSLILGAAAAVVSTVAAFASSAEAGSTRYYVCWTLTSGGSDCAYLPSDYQISGVRKPRCENAKYCTRGTVSFKLNHDIIDCLSAYIDTSSMKPTHTATIYAPDKAPAR